MTIYNTPADRNQSTHLGAHEDGPTTLSPGDSDPVSSGLKLWADVGLSIGQDVQALNRQVGSLAAKIQNDTPVVYTTQASGTFVTGSPLILNLGGPDMGYVWEVQNVVVGGSDYNTTAAGTAGLYVGPTAISASNGLTALIDMALTLPNVGFYGTRQVFINDQQNLYLVINGGTNAQQYVAVARAPVYNTSAAAGNVEVTA